MTVPDPALDLLRTLVSIDSVNPSLVPGGAGEAQAAAAVADALRKGGLEVEVEEVAPGRPNVVGLLEGRGPGRSLMLCGHLDTVGVAGMDRPFDPVERDGRLHGRGAQDMKGGLAAILDAARRVAAAGLPKGRLVVAAVADEECGSIGAEALVRRWRADGAVVAEPTDMVVGVGHRGFSWVEIVTRGRAAHGSRPREGRDAIFDMGRALRRLEALDRRLQSRSPHPLLGTASLHASLVEGGREWSTYPDRCALRYERRNLVGEDLSLALAEANEILAALTAEDGQFEATARGLFDRPAYEIPVDHPLVESLGAVLRDRGRWLEPAGMSFWTDAAILGGAGIPSVVFGPGGAGLHGPEEHARIDDVLACRDVFRELIAAWCAG